MKEIELKAHVYDKKQLLEKLKTFAQHEKTVLREDQYFRFYKTEKDHITARLRKETVSFPEKKEFWLLTYKKKEVRTSGSGAATEINDEFETEVKDPVPVITLLKDTGFVPHITKRKEVIDFCVDTEFGKAEIEVCNIEKLGDFVEIEIIKDTEDENLISKIQDKLKELLVKSGLPLENIENRYYSDLLLQLQKSTDNK